IYQEVIDPGNEAVRKSEYYANGNVIESEYGKLIGAKFLGIGGQTLSQLQTLGESWGLMPSEKAIVFIDNHDKQRGHGGGGTYLTYKDGKLYDLANIFMLAFPYGTPQIMSSYAFSTSDQGPPADANGHTDAVYRNRQVNCFGKWVCEHRRPAIAQMVNFRNQISPNAPVTHWWSNEGNQIAFGRGNQAFVVINRSPQLLTQTFQTRLPAGRYCDVITGGWMPRGSCTSEFTVDSQGRLTLSLEGMAAIALHIGARLES
ncbi:MAG: ATPase, partial [Leptolyngbyaceae cyanobacterium CRU_2_3]|nr:ATPase [Leptolyngbyaceae cyanobacterium CRU_2_3]